LYNCYDGLVYLQLGGLARIIAAACILLLFTIWELSPYYTLMEINSYGLDFRI